MVHKKQYDDLTFHFVCAVCSLLLCAAVILFL